MGKVFLSHKQHFANEAEQLDALLSKAVPGANVFRSEDIDKGKEWRTAIDEELDDAKCFVLLYTSPEQDWSWCFYEAGRFSRKGRRPRPVGCLHPEAIELPSPLANLQGIKARSADIRKWLGGQFFRDVRSSKPSAAELGETADAIEKLVNGMPTKENFLKPYIWIVPKTPTDWDASNKSRTIDFSNASVEVDRISANSLGFSDTPSLELLPFLRRISCETDAQPGKIEFWISKFFESLQGAVDGMSNFQEEAYFRHENGKILRPVVVSFTRCAGGPVCRLRVIFAEAFGSPLTDAPGPTQRLSIGARLAIRTRLEIVDPFIGRVSQIQLEKSRSRRAEDEIGRKIGIGSRLVEALDTIVREAASHGMRLGEDPPKLFEGAAQHEYEAIRDRGQEVWTQLNEAAPIGDQTGDYSKTETMLGELKRINEDYLALALPRLEELLVPATKRRRSS